MKKYEYNGEAFQLFTDLKKAYISNPRWNSNIKTHVEEI
jgi:hypothetical protein